MNLIEVARRMIAIDSTPSHGTKELVEYLSGLCEGLGLAVEIQSETLNGLEQLNILARPSRSKPEEEFLLQTRLDTVEPGNFAMWTKTEKNPFNASIYGDEMIGLGVADCKLDFLCKISAAQEFSQKKMSRPFVLVGTFGAHSAMTGALKLMRRKLVKSRQALIGEATGLRLVHAGLGLAVVEVSIPFSEEEIRYRTNHDLMESASTQSRVFSGKAAHSSNPEMGENAIQKMLDTLDQLPEGIVIMDIDGGINHNSVPSSAVLEIDLVSGIKDPMLPKLQAVSQALKDLELEFKKVSDAEMTPAHATMNLGMIRIFEDQVRMMGSCRLPPSVSDVTYQRWMENLKMACEKVGASFRVCDYKKGFFTASDAELVKLGQKTLKTMGESSELLKTPLSTEASVFSRMGIECLVFGPGQGAGNSHAPNEKVKISDLEKATEFYKEMIKEVCL